MKDEFLSLPLIKNEEKKRFELEVEGHIAFTEYLERNNVIRLIHTESPEAIAGRGVATALVEKTLNYIEQNNYLLIPLCPLVFAYIKRHPEWKRIVDPSFNKWDA
jgi:predicted GNAT family acetyltransferase